MILVDSSVCVEYYRSTGDPRYSAGLPTIRQDHVAVSAIFAAETPLRLHSPVA